jgi:hypothetical protein
MWRSDWRVCESTQSTVGAWACPRPCGCKYEGEKGEKKKADKPDRGGDLSAHSEVRSSLNALAGEARHRYNKTLLLLKIFVFNIPLAYRNLSVKRPVL